MKFTYNNSFQASIGMTPFEALYGRPCKSPSCWVESTERLLLGFVMVRETLEKVGLIRTMKTAQDRQKYYAHKRKRDIKFEVGDLVVAEFNLNSPY